MFSVILAAAIAFAVTVALGSKFIMLLHTRKIAQFDRDYEEYCRERQQSFDRDFDSWRRSRLTEGGGGSFAVLLAFRPGLDQRALLIWRAGIGNRAMGHLSNCSGDRGLLDQH